MRSGLCESCGLVPAELALCVSSASGLSRERRLCGECARDAERIMFGNASLLHTELLLAVDRSGTDSLYEGNRIEVCPGCGHTASEVQKTGMMGCATCYEVFRKEIEPITTM